MNRISLIAIGVVLGAGVAIAQAKKPFTAAEMQALLGKGLVVNSMDLEGGKHFTGRVNLEAGGKLSGTLTVSWQRPIALRQPAANDPGVIPRMVPRAVIYKRR